jgi:diguanylate cyclase (GGDEF)-like protein
MLRYLAGQAAISVENVELHELITEGAITDELTGLANRRRFEELLEDEAQRAERFGNELSVLLLRIDDLDRVGVAHGRLQADLALREMARVLQTESRGVDHPARYEGSEFAVALPETGTEGALELSDRVRTRIEHARIPLTDGEGTLRLEASMGIATMTGGQGSPRDLVAAARAALDRATAAGGGRAEVAHLPARPDVESRMQ